MSDYDSALAQMSIAEFLEKLGSSEPTPGGGSAAALVGALSSSLISMVANLTTGKENYEEVEKKFTKLAKGMDMKTNDFLKLADEDKRAFDEVMKVLQTPNKTDEQKQKKLQEALKEATEPPLATAELAHEILDYSEYCVKEGNKHAITDAGAAAILGYAALSSALLNVDINLTSIQDKDFVKRKRDHRDKLQKSGQQKLKRVIDQIKKRLQ